MNFHEAPRLPDINCAWIPQDVFNVDNEFVRKRESAKGKAVKIVIP